MLFGSSTTLGPPFEYSPELSGFSGLRGFARDPLGSLERAHRERGPLIWFDSLMGVSVMVHEPKLVEDLLIGHHASCIKERFTRQLGIVLGQGLLTSEHEQWKRQRRLAAPSFKRGEIGTYAQAMVRRAVEYREQVSSSRSTELHRGMMELTLRIVVDTLLGASAPPAERVGELLDTIMREYQELGMTWRVALPTWWPLRSRRVLVRARRQLETLVGTLIDEKRKAGGTGHDLLSRLLAARGDGGERMSDEQLLDETVTVFLAGHETVALALTFTLHLLARHPEIQARLHAELDHELGGRAPTLTDWERLTYTRAVVSEGLRVYPPAWALGRETFEPIELAGQRIPTGTRILACPWIIQRDERWFPDPLSFRPERWLSGETERLPRFAYWPFGGGPRVCIGNHFALLEVTMVLSTLLQRLGVSTADDHGPALSPSITLRPAGPVNVEWQMRNSGAGLEAAS